MLESCPIGKTLEDVVASEPQILSTSWGNTKGLAYLHLEEEEHRGPTGWDPPLGNVVGQEPGTTMEAAMEADVEQM